MRYNVHIAYGYWCHLIKHTLIFIFISLLFSVILFQLPQSFHLVSSHKHISECANINNNMSLNRFSMVNKLCMLNLRVDATSKTGWYLSVLFYYYLARHLPRNIIYIIHRTHTHKYTQCAFYTYIHAHSLHLSHWLYSPFGCRHLKWLNITIAYIMLCTSSNKCISRKKWQQVNGECTDLKWLYINMWHTIIILILILILLFRYRNTK